MSVNAVSGAGSAGVTSESRNQQTTLPEQTTTTNGTRTSTAGQIAPQKRGEGSDSSNEHYQDAADSPIPVETQTRTDEGPQKESRALWKETMLKKASKGDQLLRKKIDSVQLEHLMKKTNEEVGGGNISQPEVHAVQEGNQDQTTPHPYANAEWYLEECAALALALNDPYQGTKLKDLMNKWDQAQATEYIMKYINKYQVEQMVTMGAWSEKIVKRLWRSGGLLQTKTSSGKCLLYVDLSRQDPIIVANHDKIEEEEEDLRLHQEYEQAYFEWAISEKKGIPINTKGVWSDQSWVYLQEFFNKHQKNQFTELQAWNPETLKSFWENGMLKYYESETREGIYLYVNNQDNKEGSHPEPLREKEEEKMQGVEQSGEPDTRNQARAPIPNERPFKEIEMYLMKLITSDEWEFIRDYQLSLQQIYEDGNFVTEKVEGEEIFSLNREAYKEKGPVAFPPRKEWYNWARKEDDKEGIANDETIMSEKYRQSRIDTNARNKWSAEMATYVLKKLSKNDQIRIRDARLDMALMYEIGDMFVVEDGIVNTLLIRIEDGRNAWELTKEDIESALKDMKLKDLYQQDQEMKELGKRSQPVKKVTYGDQIRQKPITDFGTVGSSSKLGRPQIGPNNMASLIPKKQSAEVEKQRADTEKSFSIQYMNKEQRDMEDVEDDRSPATKRQYEEYMEKAVLNSQLQAQELGQKITDKEKTDKQEWNRRYGQLDTLKKIGLEAKAKFNKEGQLLPIVLTKAEMMAYQRNNGRTHEGIASNMMIRQYECDGVTKTTELRRRYVKQDDFQTTRQKPSGKDPLDYWNVVRQQGDRLGYVQLGSNYISNFDTRMKTKFRNLPDTDFTLELVERVTAKEANGPQREYKKWVYLLGDTTVISNMKNDDILTMCKALVTGMTTKELETHLFETVNLCRYYAYGTCIHPECGASHLRDMREILHIYWKQRKMYLDEEGVRVCEERSDAHVIAQEWHNAILKLSKKFSGSFMYDYPNHLARLNYTAHIGKKKGAKVLRQYLLGQLEVDPEGVSMYAFAVQMTELFVPSRRVNEEPLETSYYMETRRILEKDLRQVIYERQIRRAEWKGVSWETLRNFKFHRLINPQMTSRKISQLTRGNTNLYHLFKMQKNKWFGVENVSLNDRYAIQFDDNEVFKNYTDEEVMTLKCDKSGGVYTRQTYSLEAEELKELYRMGVANLEDSSLYKRVIGESGELIEQRFQTTDIRVLYGCRLPDRESEVAQIQFEIDIMTEFLKKEYISKKAERDDANIIIGCTILNRKKVFHEETFMMTAVQRTRLLGTYDFDRIDETYFKRKFTNYIIQKNTFIAQCSQAKRYEDQRSAAQREYDRIKAEKQRRNQDEDNINTAYEELDMQADVELEGEMTDEERKKLIGRRLTDKIYRERSYVFQHQTVAMKKMNPRNERKKRLKEEIMQEGEIYRQSIWIDLITEEKRRLEQSEVTVEAAKQHIRQYDQYQELYESLYLAFYYKCNDKYAQWWTEFEKIDEDPSPENRLKRHKTLARLYLAKYMEDLKRKHKKVPLWGQEKDDYLDALKAAATCNNWWTKAAKKEKDQKTLDEEEKKRRSQLAKEMATSRSKKVEQTKRVEREIAKEDKPGEQEPIEHSGDQKPSDKEIEMSDNEVNEEEGSSLQTKPPDQHAQEGDPSRQ